MTRRFPIYLCAGLALCAGLIALAASGCKESGSSSSGGGNKITIAVIPKGTSHAFWLSVKAGVDKAAQEENVEAIWKGPLKEDDIDGQIKMVNQFISDNISGIALAPLNSVGLVQPVQSAVGKKIPVVIFDSALKGEPGKDFVSFVATNNTKGGELAGEHLAKLLGGKGKVVLLRYMIASASTEEREKGFMDVIKANPGIQVISDNRRAGPSEDTAKKEALQMVDVLKDADGIFCPNESSTLGMLEALRDNHLLGKVKFVGFDASPKEVAALQAGEVQGLIAQDPTKMGYLAVKTLVQHIRGQKVETVVDTGVRLITPEKLSDPETKQFLGIK